MTSEVYKTIKKRNGEDFARTLRDHHNGILEIEGIADIVRHAGRDAKDATALLPYLTALMTKKNEVINPTDIEDPFVLLDRAGYSAFYADTLEKQNSISSLFAKGELLCTFNDAARHKKYHIIHAVKKDVENIQRADFLGKEERQDAYGTSVISIQMLKSGGFISIKNRYNHTVKGCDHTFNSNPDNIIPGLSAALKNHFNVEFSRAAGALPNLFVEMGERVLKYHREIYDIYYGDQAYAVGGTVHTVDTKAGDALFDKYLFDSKTKTLRNIDPKSDDSFPVDFSRDYKAQRGLLHVKNGNLMLGKHTLIGAKESRIVTLDLPALATMGNDCLNDIPALTSANFPALATMGNDCLNDIPALTSVNFPALGTMGSNCLYKTGALTALNAPALGTMGSNCLYQTGALTALNAPALTTMGDWCLSDTPALTSANLPALITMGHGCFRATPSLTSANFPALTTMGHGCFHEPLALTSANFPALTTMGHGFFHKTSALISINLPALTTMGDDCFSDTPSLISVNLPALTTIGNFCLKTPPPLTSLIVPRLNKAGEGCAESTSLDYFMVLPALPQKPARVTRIARWSRLCFG